MKKRSIISLAFAAICLPMLASAQEIIPITFPLDATEDEFVMQDTFGASRGTRSHEGVDIMADQMVPVVAAASGEVTFAPMDEPSYGYMISIRGNDGYEYHYIHLNNDTPGTDDGNGGPENAYAPGIKRGTEVEEGQLIGWVGDSGNAEEVANQLHFEIRGSNDVAINPYPSLLASLGRRDEENRNLDYDRLAELERATTISFDKDLPDTNQEHLCETNSLIRTPDVSTVYYCGSDGGRYAFQNESTYFSWYEDFDSVETISTEAMGNVPLKGIVTYRPGSYLIKLQTDPKVYAIAADGELRWVTSSVIAEALYGTDWADMVRDVPDAFFPRYKLGNPIE